MFMLNYEFVYKLFITTYLFLFDDLICVMVPNETVPQNTLRNVKENGFLSLIF